MGLGGGRKREERRREERRGEKRRGRKEEERRGKLMRGTKGEIRKISPIVFGGRRGWKGDEDEMVSGFGSRRGGRSPSAWDE